jgi:hypothetical protein
MSKVILLALATVCSLELFAGVTTTGGREASATCPSSCFFTTKLMLRSYTHSPATPVLCTIISIKMFFLRTSYEIRNFMLCSKTQKNRFADFELKS